MTFSSIEKMEKIVSKKIVSDLANVINSPLPIFLTARMTFKNGRSRGCERFLTKGLNVATIVVIAFYGL